MSPPVSHTPSPSPAPLSASAEPSSPVARCGHYIYSTSTTAIDSLDIELCTSCELRAAVTSAANARTAEDSESAYEELLVWRKSRLELANFEFATEGTDGCSAGYEFTPEQHEKFCRDVALRLVEGDDLEQLQAEIEADEAEERAAATAATEEGVGATTTTTGGDAQIAETKDFAKSKITTYAINSALKGARAGRGLSPQINDSNKRKRSRSITLAASADVDGDEDSHDHCDEDSYRSSSAYRRPNKRSASYDPGRWAPPRDGWLDTSGSEMSFDQWEREALDDGSRRQLRSGRLT